MNSTNAISTNSQVIRLLLLLCKWGLFLGVIFLYGKQPAFPQNFSKAFLKCYETDQARYQCYTARFSNLLERAKELADQRQLILESKALKRLELQVPISAKREMEREEIRKLVEASRKRNVSHQGEKYSITYGFVLEPRE